MRTGAALLCAAVGALSAGCELRDAAGPAGAGATTVGGASGPVEKASASGATDSPEAVARAAGAAQQRSDWHGLFACYTPESIDMLLDTYVEQTLLQRNLSAAFPQAAEGLRPLLDAFAKHGIDAAAWDSVPKGEERAAALEGLSARVQDRLGCTADVMQALKTIEKNSGQGGSVSAMQFPTEFELRDVRIAGETADAVSATKIDGREQLFPIRFRRVSGAWKIDLAATMQAP